jgi:hypothetical protein
MSIAALVALNFDYYRWFARQRGVGFALGVVPAHLLHHLCNGASFVLGAGLHVAARFGLTFPATLPTSGWPLAVDSAGRPS